MVDGEELVAMACAADAEGVLLRVVDDAGAAVARHGDVSPYGAFLVVGRDIDGLAFGGGLVRALHGATWRGLCNGFRLCRRLFNGYCHNGVELWLCGLRGRRVILFAGRQREGYEAYGEQ